MKVVENKDKAIAGFVKNALKMNNGYCPCIVLKTDDTECMCKEFREKIEDETFYGFCRCKLYEKIKD